MTNPKGGWRDGYSLPRPAWPSPLAPIAFGIAVGLGYFLAARLSLHFLTPTDGVAVFWPAAGIGLGVLIAFGPRARLLVAAGVMAATVAANLLGDRNLASAISFAFANAGEAVFAAWLINWRFGSNFRLGGVRQVLGLFAATAVATAVAAVGATAAMILFHDLNAPLLTTWFNWFASDALGAITVAPLILGIVHTARSPLGKSEALEGTLAVLVLAAVSAITFGASSDYWFTIEPLGLILPFLLWPAARCRPLFAAAGVFAVALMIVWTSTFGIGRLGDPSVSVFDRVLVARLSLLGVALCGFILAALFAERRDNEAILAESVEQLRLAVDGARLGVWRLDLATNRFENDIRDRQIHGHSIQAPPATLAEARTYIHPDDLTPIDDSFRASWQKRSNFGIEYRLAPVVGSMSERWVALQATIRRDTWGRPVQLLGVTHDITERKQSEVVLQRSERKIRELLDALPAAIYVTDAEGYVTYCNEAAVGLWKTKPKLGEDKWWELARYYDSDGAPMSIEDCPTEIALKQGRSSQNMEAILERRDGSRVPILPCPTPLCDAAGGVIGVINMTIDISERKNAELALAERNVQLDLAGKVALVGTFTYEIIPGLMTISPGYAAIHGLPEGSEKRNRADWRARVHPDDLPGLDARIQRTLAARRSDHYCSYRIVLPDGEVRWIESRCFISYETGGPRMIGANIDVTHRKQVEQALAERNMQLARAERAGGVGSYVHEVGASVMQFTEGYAALHGLPDGTLEMSRSEWGRQVFIDDLARIDDVRAQAFRERREEYGIEYRIVRPGGEVRWIESRSFISYDEDNEPRRVAGLNIDVTAHRRAEDHQQMLIAELDHRVKNVLATVAAVAGSTLQSSPSMQHFVAALDSRIRALASTHELLSTRRWQGLPLYDLVWRQLSPYAARNNTRAIGPDVLLKAEAGQAVAMVLHELVTNAAKYGALSTNKGRISVQWRWPHSGAEGDRLIIDWREVDGPIVTVPGKSGYGTSVINELVPYELGGKVDFEFSRTGVRCRLEIPAKWTIDARLSGASLNSKPEKNQKNDQTRMIAEALIKFGGDVGRFAPEHHRAAQNRVRDSAVR